MYVVGVDGCKGGWIAARYDVEASTLSYQVHRTFAELIAAHPDAKAIAVDIPIGLIECAPRQCDVLARKTLGRKGSSVFPAPDPRVVDSPTFAEALRRGRELCGKGMPIMAFSIFPKIDEVNREMMPSLQERVIEVHPEVCFWALNDHQPVMSKKRGPDGYWDRQTLLMQTLGIPIPNRLDASKLARPAKPDDILDAIVAGWTARRWAEGQRERLPADPPLDARGLRMEMVYAGPIESGSAMGERRLMSDDESVKDGNQPAGPSRQRLEDLTPEEQRARLDRFIWRDGDVTIIKHPRNVKTSASQSDPSTAETDDESTG